MNLQGYDDKFNDLSNRARTTATTGGMMLMPPHPSLCQECAHKHPAEEPHDATSLFYQTKFNMRHNRGATWADAMAHCTEDMKAAWADALKAKFDIDINSSNVYGNALLQAKKRRNPA